ncbi:MAG: hypothetical protein HRU24_01655 [Gammaproteobacteria bacterium]|nr:hypothetical protein [Gammaproteobacteria bacterium]
MKIISLKGENLASLSAPFSIDFAEGVLADAGLFAICGNTGSGKSTLLDAICLSLFDAMPRFNSARRGPAIGHHNSEENERLKSNDVRHILTRGAASAYSEVVFELEDAKQYCARWSVKRARGSASGRIQAQEMSLTCLANEQILATKKTEVLSHIEQLIGLNYDQFRRSVLLAQGDFAAFLKAPAKERSELLERITGTQLYSEISKLAFLRAKDEEQQLMILRERLGEVMLLSAEQQQSLASQLGQVNESICEVNEQTRQLTWLEQHLISSKLLEAQVATSRVLCEDASQAMLAHEQTAELVEQVELAQRARPINEQLNVNNQQQQQYQQQLAQFVDTNTTQQVEIDEIDGQVKQLRLVNEQTSQQFEQQLPLLEHAINQQVEVTHLNHQLVQKQQQLEQLSEQQTTVDRRLKGNNQQQQRQQILINDLSVFINENHQLEKLTTQLNVLEQTINDHQQASISCQQYQQQASDLKKIIGEKEQQLTQLKHTQTEQKQQQQQLTENLARLQPHHQGQDLNQLELLIEQEQQQLANLISQQQLANQGLQYQVMISDKQRQQQELAEQLQQTKLDYRATRDKLSQLTPAVAEAEHALLGAQQIMSLTEHRAQLVSQQPCALCGSCDHPYAEDVNIGERLVDQLSQRSQCLNQDLNQLKTQLVQCEAIGNQLVEQQASVISEIEQLSSLLSAISTIEITPQVLAQIETEIVGQQQSLADKKQQQIALSEMIEQVRTLEKELSSHLHHEELTLQNLQQCQFQLTTAQTDCNIALDYQQQMSQQMSARVVLLSEFYPPADWEALLAKASLLEQFKRELAGKIEQYIEKNNYKNEISVQLQDLEQQHIALTAEQSHLQRQAQPLTEQVEQLIGQVAQLQQEIDQLCQGKTPQDLKQVLQDHLAQLATALRNAEQGLTSSKNKQLVIQSQQQQVQQQQQTLNAQIQQLEQQWQQWLAQLALSHQELQQLLNYDHQWVIEQRQQQASLNQHHHQAQAVYADQQRSLALQHDELVNHQQQLIETLPELSPQPAQTSEQQRQMLQQSLSAALKQYEQNQFDLRSQLEQHNQAMIRHGELQQQIDDQTSNTELWLAMKDLIGAADGAKFRTFAQSLTLEQMLLSANHHLKELAPRYQLQRVPGAELDLQIVDQDMGDDIRSIESLSGGETFLVSLALALGLGSITSLQTNIKTLFIDEGFGTLDPDTLEVALSCLDSLQASGRQIGLISHVQGLVERVGTRVQITAQGNGHSKVEIFAR